MDLSKMTREEARAFMNQPVDPIRLFDDVWFIGRRGVGVFAIPTSEGIVLIDSMDPVDAAEQYIEPGFAKIGLDPRDINTIIITHGHGDHFLGAKHLQNKYGCKACLGEIDTAFMMTSDLMDTMERTEFPHIDFYLEDRKELRFGEHCFIPVLTPGHTPGCMSLIFNVHDNGQEHWASLWGGAGLTMLRLPPVEKMYWACRFAASAQMFLYECDKYGCDVVLGVHPHRMDLFEKLEQRTEGGPNVFIVGREGVRDNLHVRGQEALDVAQKALDEM